MAMAAKIFHTVLWLIAALINMGRRLSEPGIHWREFPIFLSYLPHSGGRRGIHLVEVLTGRTQS
jgi:hypothetical protein